MPTFLSAIQILALMIVTLREWSTLFVSEDQCRRCFFPLFRKNDFAAAAKSLQLCPTLCNPIDGSPPGSPVPGILQARTLEWGAISFSNAWKWKVKVKSLSSVHTTMYKTDNKQGPTVLHRKLYSRFCNNLYRKRTWKRMYICMCITITCCTPETNNTVNKLYSNTK